MGKIPWRRKWQPTPVFLLRESHRQGSMVGYSPGGRKESNMTEKTLHSTTQFLVVRTYILYLGIFNSILGLYVLGASRDLLHFCHPDNKNVSRLRQMFPGLRASDLRAPIKRQRVGEGNGNPLQHSCLGNSIDRGV